MARALFIAGTALALVALIAGPAFAEGNVGRHMLQATMEFPPLCNCIRDPNQSPYRLSLIPPVVETGFVKHCFTVTNVGGCDPKLTCCNGRQGVEKVEFDVVAGCKDSLRRVTVDGALKSFEYNTKLNVLRITNLNKTAATGPGTQVCLFLRANSTCTTLNRLCGAGGVCKYAIFNPTRDCCPVSTVGSAPPPPNPPFVPAIAIRSPPPPSAFPWCACQREAELSKLTTTLSSVSTVSNLTRACFTIQTKASCLLGSECCEFPLYKFELDAQPTCSSSLVYSTLDGVRKPRFFQQRPYPVVKVTNIDKPFSAVSGTEVCLFLRAPCDSLDKLCAGGKCTIALFNKPGSRPSCCPLTTV